MPVSLDVPKRSEGGTFITQTREALAHSRPREWHVQRHGGRERVWQFPNHTGDMGQQAEGSMERQEAGEISRGPDSKGHAGPGKELDSVLRTRSGPGKEFLSAVGH